jgi:FkbM family methyltransferase
VINFFVLSERLKTMLYRFNLRLVRANKGTVNFEDYDLIIDVGANIGQFGTKARVSGYTGLIYSFEPQSEAHRILSARKSNDKNWIIEAPCALGAKDGEVDLKISKNSFSSSLLEVNATHLGANINSQTVSTEKVKVRTLDSFLDSKFVDQSRIFLKIDVQGFELEVLQGTELSLSRISTVQVELSTTTLYQGQSHFMKIISFLDFHGFEIWDLQNGFRDSKSGRLLQFDGIFKKVREV